MVFDGDMAQKRAPRRATIRNVLKLKKNPKDSGTNVPHIARKMYQLRTIDILVGFFQEIMTRIVFDLIFSRSKE